MSAGSSDDSFVLYALQGSTLQQLDSACTQCRPSGTLACCHESISGTHAFFLSVIPLPLGAWSNALSLNTLWSWDAGAGFNGPWLDFGSSAWPEVLAAPSSRVQDGLPDLLFPCCCVRLGGCCWTWSLSASVTHGQPWSSTLSETNRTRKQSC